METIIKDIPGFESYYKVSSSGVVISKRTGRCLKHCISKRTNIPNVKLSVNNIVKTVSVARIMALTFIENPNPKLYKSAIVKNGAQSDLRIDNIMWGTVSISTIRKLKRTPKLLDNFKAVATKINTRKMTDKLELQMVNMRRIGYSIKQLTDIFPIKKSQVSNILKKHNYGNTTA